MIAGILMWSAKKGTCFCEGKVTPYIGHSYIWRNQLSVKSWDIMLTSSFVQ